MTGSPEGGIGAILLAGGRGSRVDGAMKPLFEVGGRTLLRAAVTAAEGAGASRITVAAPLLDDTLDVAWVREDPPFGGPAAAVVTALDSWSARSEPEWTLLLACDLPGAPAVVQRLLDAHARSTSAVDALCLADPGGRAQWLAGIYRTRPLRAAASRLPDRGRDQAMRALTDGLSVALVPDPENLAQDVDTWDDLSQARERADTDPASHATEKNS